MKKLSQIVLMLVALSLSAAGLAREAAQAEGQGEINDLSFGTNEMVVGEVAYDVSPNAKVEIAGSFGAFTMLTEGMLVEFIYMHHPNGRREIIEMREVGMIEEY